ncbi:phage integrase SAM-like domain-containing protein [Mariniflexile sp. HNIBRBA6329]|uniref:phage integrase SAM-like domain-containing protein n=1 Tax=Mariniflexile sp. HNIBRBA6329 TaxID=3373088 RepID=UPI0037468AB0
MASVNFLYRSVKTEAPLQLRLLFRYEDIDYVFAAKTKLLITKEYWDKQHKLKKPKDIEILNRQFEIKTELKNIESYFLNSFHSTHPKLITKEWVEKVMELYYNPKGLDKSIPETLIGYIKYFVKQKEKEVASASIKKFNVIKHKLQRLESYYNTTLLVEDVDESFKNRFVEFCKMENYAINTIQRELGLIKTFCKHARANGIKVSNQMDTLKVQKEKVSHIFLSFKELESINKTELKHDYLKNARDWLIISCYLGQRISDFMRFRKNMIREENGKYLLEFTQKKTKKVMTIPIHPKVLEILSKNGGDFPRQISHKCYNEYIKLVCKKAKIKEKVKGRKQDNISEDDAVKQIRNVEKEYKKWELVTSHIGRRSFATNFYGQIPTNFLIYVTGHSTESMFLSYIGKSNKDIALELTKYF